MSGFSCDVAGCCKFGKEYTRASTLKAHMLKFHSDQQPKGGRGRSSRQRKSKERKFFTPKSVRVSQAAGECALINGWGTGGHYGLNSAPRPVPASGRADATPACQEAADAEAKRERTATQLHFPTATKFSADSRLERGHSTRSKKRRC